MNDFPVTEQELIDWTCALVRIPSYNGIPAQEHAAAEYIRNVFVAEGITCHIDALENGRANVVAILEGGKNGKRLMLNGHLDTVPPYDMENACTPVIRDGRILGRGSSDMKGPLASMMGALIGLKRSGKRLAGDLIFTAVADEEAGSLGCIELIQKGYLADAAVVCEPLGVQNVGVAQKGLEWYEITFSGRTVHGGSQDAGVNAIEKAVRFITEANAVLLPVLNARTHPLLGRSTMNFAVIRGGTQPSTVPGTCTLQLDRRFLPGSERYDAVGQELQAILDRLEAEDKDFHAQLRVLPASYMKDGYVHQGFETDAAHALVRGCAQAIEQVTGRAASLMGCPCWTDGGLLAHYAGIPTVVWGPGKIALCHSKEEYIDTAELFQCARGYAALAEMFCV